MISQLTGKVVGIDGDRVTVEINGVGYEVVVSLNFLENIKEGDKSTFYIAENIKENEYTLFGLPDIESRSMYYKLTSVNGVGPKAAMAILSNNDSSEVYKAIIADDVSFFNEVTGIGKKTAQRIILELKGKLVDATEEVNKDDIQAQQALISLGYSAKDAKEILKEIDSKLPLEDRIKLALKGVRND